ncbi:LOW QUALITY PROTEIN: uncharacterized protein ACWYII_035631 [Salvelinus alpinus]
METFAEISGVQPMLREPSGITTHLSPGLRRKQLWQNALYQQHSSHQRGTLLAVIDALAKLHILVLYLVCALCGLTGLFMAVSVALCLVLTCDLMSPQWLHYAGLASWLSLTTHVLGGLAYRLERDPTYVLFATYTLLPLPLLWAMCAGLLTSALELLKEIIRHYNKTLLLYTVLATGLLYLGMNTAGLFIHYLMERAQRQTCRCIEGLLEKENQRPCIVLSILPCFLALEMIADMGALEDELIPQEFQIYIHQYKYFFVLSGVIAMVTCAVFLKLSSLLKLAVLLLVVAVYSYFIQVAFHTLYVNEQEQESPYLRRKGISILLMTMFVVAVFYNRRQWEATARLDFLWRLQAQQEGEDMRELREHNGCLLHNILPLHVTRHFLEGCRNNEELYSQSYVGVMFASVAGFTDYYEKKENKHEGVDCLRLLNEIIADFDEVRGDKKGVRPRQSFAIFCIAHGPVVARVISATKPQYDIWGQVNLASRMDSTGVSGRIQVPEATRGMLAAWGFVLELRGQIYIKGVSERQGKVRTYFIYSSHTQRASNGTGGTVRGAIGGQEHPGSGGVWPGTVQEEGRESNRVLFSLAPNSGKC